MLRLAWNLTLILQEFTMKTPFLIFVLVMLAGHNIAQHPDSLQLTQKVDSLLVASEQLFRARKNAEALPLVQQAADISRQAWGASNLRYAASLHRLGAIYMNMADYKKAEALDLEAISIRQKVLGKQDPNYARTINNLGVLYVTTGNFEKAEPLFLEALTVFEKKLGEKHALYANCIAGLGDLYYRMGNYEQAEIYFLKSAEIPAEVLGKENPNYAASLNDLTRLYMAMGNYKKAQLLNQEAVTIFEKAQLENISYAFSLDHAARLSSYAGNLPQAEVFLLKSKAIKEKILGKEHPDYATSLNNLAYLYMLMENYEKAEPVYLEAIALYEKVFGKEHPSYATSEAGLANLYRNTGQYTKAEPLLLETLAIWEKTKGKESDSYSNNLLDLANLYLTSGNYKQAGSDLSESANLQRRLLFRASGYLSEQEMFAYKKTFINGLDYDFSFAYTHNGLTGTCYDNTLFYKGFLLNAHARLNKLALADPATTEKFNQFNLNQRHLAAEYAKPIDERENVAELETTANDMEKEITRSVAGFGEALRQVTWQEVQQKLKQEEAAVEFVHYRYFHPQATDSILYAALVIKPGDPEPQFIPLFEEKELSTLTSGCNSKCRS
jgi:tetratricopeptide (TPR) repeat protein